jgi:hypothetical protein
MKRIASVVLLALMSGSGVAQAATYSFACLSNSNVTNCADGAANLVMDATDAGTTAQGIHQVDFTFHNFSALGSAITEIYFDDGTLLGISSLSDSGAGVNFTDEGVNPNNLPSANSATPAFSTTTGFSADVVKNTADGIHNALDSGTQEFLTIRFDLINGQNYAATLDALNGVMTHSSGGIAYPALRVGLHVRSFSNGGSESFMNVVPEAAAAPIPESNSYALMFLGMGLVGLLARRRKA